MDNVCTNQLTNKQINHNLPSIDFDTHSPQKVNFKKKK